MKRLEQQSKTREQNAAYLTSRLNEIPGIKPAKQYPGCTRNAYHLYMFRTAAASREGLLKALRAANIGASTGYSPLNREPFIKTALARYHGAQEIAAWEKRNHCPENDRLCTEAVWFTQNQLLADRSDMDVIVKAIAGYAR
jgi:dTDP-4-amino-4,6-dideoxygalactose transaminase